MQTDPNINVWPVDRVNAYWSSSYACVRNARTQSSAQIAKITTTTRELGWTRAGG